MAQVANTMRAGSPVIGRFPASSMVSRQSLALAGGVSVGTLLAAVLSRLVPGLLESRPIKIGLPGEAFEKDAGRRRANNEGRLCAGGFIHLPEPSFVIRGIVRKKFPSVEVPIYHGGESGG